MGSTFSCKFWRGAVIALLAAVTTVASAQETPTTTPPPDARSTPSGPVDPALGIPDIDFRLKGEQTTASPAAEPAEPLPQRDSAAPRARPTPAGGRAAVPAPAVPVRPEVREAPEAAPTDPPPTDPEAPEATGPEASADPIATPAVPAAKRDWLPLLAIAIMALLALVGWLWLRRPGQATAEAAVGPEPVKSPEPCVPAPRIEPPRRAPRQPPAPAFGLTRYDAFGQPVREPAVPRPAKPGPAPKTAARRIVRYDALGLPIRE